MAKDAATAHTKATSYLHSVPNYVNTTASVKNLAIIFDIKKTLKMFVLSLVETDKLFYLALQNKIKKKSQSKANTWHGNSLPEH